jgi:TonB family protein
VCFFVLAALHLMIPALIRFAPPARQRSETKEMFLALESFSVPETPPAVPAPLPEALPAALPETTEAALPALPPELPETAAAVPAAEIPAAVPESAARDAFPEGTVVPGTAVPETAVPGAGTVPAVRGNGGGGTAADYMALVMRRLEEKKVYPLSVRKRGIEGDVTVDFTIGRNGAVTGITLADAAHRFLGQAAVETVRSASPFPAAPAADNQGKDYPVRVTIRYRLEEGR